MTTLGDYLKGKGFRVDDSNVPYGRDTTWDKVKWIFVHHTASTCDASKEASDANYIKTASGRYPPLAQIMLGQSGKVWMCSKQRSGQAEPGRASHAGEGVYPGIPRDCGNQMSLGIEVQCSGAHPLANHKDQYAVLIDLIADLCTRFKLDSTKVIGHKEYSSTGKIDPRDNMNAIRADVKAKMGSGSSGGSTPGSEEDTLLSVLSLKTSADQTIPIAPSWNNIDWESEGNDSANWHSDGSPSIKPPSDCWVTSYFRFNIKNTMRNGTICVQLRRQETKGSDAVYIDVDTINFEVDSAVRNFWTANVKLLGGYKYRMSIQIDALDAGTLDYALWKILAFAPPK